MKYFHTKQRYEKPLEPYVLLFTKECTHATHATSTYLQKKAIFLSGFSLLFRELPFLALPYRSSSLVTPLLAQGKAQMSSYADFALDSLDLQLEKCVGNS